MPDLVAKQRHLMLRNGSSRPVRRLSNGRQHAVVLCAVEQRCARAGCQCNLAKCSARASTSKQLRHVKR